METSRKPSAPLPPELVVSSAHLAAGSLPALSAFEFGLSLVSHAFQRWIVRCAAAAGAPGLSPTEVLVLHTVHHRGRPKRLADIALVLDIEDTHLITYALRKLEAAGLVRRKKNGKENMVETTETGAALCARYGEIRERLLVEAVRDAMGAEGAEEIMRAAQLMRTLSGFYNQAARAAATL
jgi:predicted MarR family transcription regulator